MNVAQFVKKGRQQFTILMGGLILGSVVNLVYEVFFGYSFGILGVQIFSTATIIGLAALTINGFRRKNLLFTALIFAGVYTFYQAGTRTPNLSSSEMGIPPAITLALGLAFLFGGIYLSYSLEIKAFLDSKVMVRRKRKEEEFQ